MKRNQHLAAFISSLFLLAYGLALVQENPDQRRKVSYPTSYSANAQPSFETGVAIENRLYSLPELYAELLLVTRPSVLALNEFETALKAYPNHYRSTYGIARAAEAAVDKCKTADNYDGLLVLTKYADSSRPEPARARGHT